MSYFTWKEEKCSAAGRGTRWTSQVPNYSKTIAFLADESPSGEVDICSSSHSEERPSPEGFGTSAGDAQRSTSCQRTVKSLAGQFGGSSGENDRFSAALSSGPGRCGLGMPGAADAGARRAGEERKVARCDKCSLTLVALKKQALSLVVHHHFSSKDLAAMSTFLHNNLRVHSSRSTADPREKDRDQGLCISCGVHLNQLKQEAVQLALSRENSRWPGHASPEHGSGSPPNTGHANHVSLTIAGTGSPRRQEAGQYGHDGSRDMVQLVESVGAVVPQQYSFTQGYMSPRTLQRKPEQNQDRPQDRTQDRPQDRTQDRMPQWNPERTQDRPQDRTQDRPQDRTQDRMPQWNPERTQDQPQDRTHDRPQNWTLLRTLDCPQSQTPQRIPEWNLDHPQDHPKDSTQDRTLDRPQNRTPQHTLVHPQDRHQDQTSQWTLGRPQNRTPQRNPEQTLEHPQDHPKTRTPQRTLEQFLDNPQDRPHDIHQGQTPQWNLDRPQNRTPQRNPGQTLDHPPGHPQSQTPQRNPERIQDHLQDRTRTLDRPQNRTPQRTLERTRDHPQAHPQNRTPQRTLERILDHPRERTLDRPQNRTRHRSLERILDEPQDHPHDRHQDRYQDHTPQWNPVQTLDRPQDRTHCRTPQWSLEQPQVRTTHWNSEQTLNRSSPQRTLNQTLDRPQNRSPLLTLDRSQNRTPQRTMDRTAHWKSEQTLNRTLDRPQHRTPQQTPERTPQTLRRRGPKTPNPDMNRWVAEQQQMVAVVKSVAAVGGNGGDVYPYQAGGGVPEGCGGAGSSPKMAHIARVATIANSAAMAFLARAAQKLNLRRKGLSGGPGGTGRLAHHSTCFRGLIEKNPPPVPPCVFQNGSRTRELQNISQVKVILRVCPPTPQSSDGPLRAPLLRIDPSRKRVTVVEPTWNSVPRARLSQRREEKAVFKTYAFDTVYPQETGQAEVCTGILSDVIRGVVGGADGCVLGLGCVDAGSWSAMVGSDESHQRLGVIPCSIPWLYAAIERWKERTWSSLTVSVSAVELRWGGRAGPGEGEESLRDLLAEVAPAPTPSGPPDRPAAHIALQEDPLLGVQLRNHNRVKCPTAERAASLLDSAIASRLHGNQAEGRGGGDDITAPAYHSSVMFFTMHVQPPRTDLSANGKAPRAPSRLTMIDVCSSMKTAAGVNKTRSEPPRSGLPSVLYSLLSGNKNIPSKGSKLTMLLKESLGRSNCLTAVIGQVSDLPVHLPEALSTIYLVSRIRRAQRRPKQSSSCSPCGRSLGKDKRHGGHRPLALRSFHSTGQVDVDTPRLRLRGDPDERSVSDQSCDTVIHIGSDGAVRDPKRARMPPLTRPPFVPIVPSLHRGESAADDPEFAALLAELLLIPQPSAEQRKDRPPRGKTDPPKVEAKPPERDCLKCETFAELQERLGCIDGSDATVDAAKLLSEHPSVDAGAAETRPQNEAAAPAPQKDSPNEAAKAPPGRLGQEYVRVRASVGDEKSDGARPEDSFQREDSGLYDCEDASAASSAEEPQGQSLGRARVLRADRTEVPDSTTPRSSSDSSEKEEPRDTGASSSTLGPAPQPAEGQRASEDGEWVKPEFRTSPIGKSYPISPPSSSSSPSPPSMAKSVLLGGILPHLPTDELKEMKATITVTVQQPLDQDGRDEIVYSMVEEVTISGALDRDAKGRSIIRIRENAQSPSRMHGGTACSQPIRIISNVIEESGTADYSGKPINPSVHSPAREPSTQQNPPPLKFRKENKLLPSFINPMLVEMECESYLDSDEPRYTPNVFFTSQQPLTLQPRKDYHGEDDRRNVVEQRMPAEARGAVAFETPYPKYDHISTLPMRQMSFDSLDLPSTASYDETKAKNYSKRQKNTDKQRSRGPEPVYPTPAPLGRWGGEAACGVGGSGPEGIAASLGCLATVHDDLKTNSLPRGWQGTRHGDGGRRAGSRHVASGATSSTPSSPRVTVERRHRRHHRSRDDGLDSSPPPGNRRHSEDERQDSGSGAGSGSSTLNRKARSLFKTSKSKWGLSKRSDSLNGLKSAATEQSCGWSFGAKLRQLARRTNSLGRTPAEFQSLDRGSSTTSVSSRASSKGSSKGSTEGKTKGSSRGSYEEIFKGKGKRSYEGESTLARNSRSPKKSPRCAPAVDSGHHSGPSDGHLSPRSQRSATSKLSAVGKLKMAAPRLRRVSNSGTRTLSFSRSDPRRSINRSASLSPDGRAFQRDQASCFPSLSSSPPWSVPSLSRTQSQSSSCCSAATKSPIHGVIDGRFSDFLKDREPRLVSAGADKGRTPIEEDDEDEDGGPFDRPGYAGGADDDSDRPFGVPSPYSRLTAPRAPAHLSGHGSDVTSVLSGELPPAMGKTSLLLFPRRSNAGGRGYEGPVRDHEAAEGGDRGAALRGAAQQDGRPARRRGHAGSKRGMMNL